MTITVRKLKKRWLSDPDFKREYDELEHEFAFARQMIAARLRAKLTQRQVAERMGTTQSVVARIESGSQPPSLKTLERYAAAIGCQLTLSLRPTKKRLAS